MRKRKVLNISNFGGVDLTSPSLSVSDSRAINLLNILKVNGVNQKRSSWEQIGKITPYFYVKEESNNDSTISMEVTNENNFNGVWSFVGEDNKNHVIAHVGKILYEIKNLDEGYKNVTFTPLSTEVMVSGEKKYYLTELNNTYSQAFVSSNRLYILDGYKYRVLRFYDNTWHLNDVEDGKDTYIPTTTIAITYTDSPVTYRTLLDDTNLLSSLRKNKLISGTLKDQSQVVRTTRFYEFALDTNVNFKEGQSTEDISIELEYVESDGE